MKGRGQEGRAQVGAGPEHSFLTRECQQDPGEGSGVVTCTHGARRVRGCVSRGAQPGDAERDSRRDSHQDSHRDSRRDAQEWEKPAGCYRSPAAEPRAAPQQPGGMNPAANASPAPSIAGPPRTSGWPPAASPLPSPRSGINGAAPAAIWSGGPAPLHPRDRGRVTWAWQGQAVRSPRRWPRPRTGVME